MNKASPFLNLEDEVKLTYADFDKIQKTGTVVLNWTLNNFGFGQISIQRGVDWKIFIDDEFIGREKVKEILCIMVDQAKLRSDDHPTRADNQAQDPTEENL